jgi:hypothetical protein
VKIFIFLIFKKEKKGEQNHVDSSFERLDTVDRYIFKQIKLLSARVPVSSRFCCNDEKSFAFIYNFTNQLILEVLFVTPFRELKSAILILKTCP